MVAYHAFGRFIDTNVTGLAPVVLFFVLSGFVLARSLARGPTITEFFRHRIFRLFPAAVAVVLLLTALHAQFGFYHGFPPDFSGVNVLLNAMLLKHDINGPMWSMTVECVATPVILVTYWICQRFGWLRVLPAIVILFGLSFVGQFTQILGGFSNLGPLYAFLVGVVLHFTGRRLAEALTGNGRTFAAIVASAVLIYCGFQKQTGWIILLETLSSGCIIALVAFAPDLRLFRFLDATWSNFFGRVSYSFYLLHMIGLSIAVRFTNIEGSPIVSALISTVLGVALTTPLAWISWQFIERPFVRLGRMLDSSPAERRQSHGAVNLAEQ